MKDILNAVMVLTGTFIGAGFASGREVIQYFGIFGNYGFVGVLLSCIIMGVFVYCAADNINLLGEEKYIEKVCGFKFVNYFIACYMLVIYCTMITAFGESLEQFAEIPKIYGVIIIDVITATILLKGAEGLIKLNMIVTPIIILGILFAQNTVQVFSYNNFALSGIVYTSYNVISLPFVMVGLKKSLATKKRNFWISGIFSVIIFILAVKLLFVLDNSDFSVSIPLLDVTGGLYRYFFIFVLGVSMLTTSVSNGYGLLNSVGNNKKTVLLFISIFSVIFSFFSFEFIVKYLYSFFGYMGLYILLINFIIFIKNKEKVRKIKNNRDKLK